ncbi:hypothetical protein BW730_03155 [Tessaracoccus aquimaris]|uniref:Cobyrinic acid a,c-diamide synthase n=1 Tax=Tessaracoccus aquimaris TaxID=1332264 RepID=A0A1Q2CKN8_9ACTN|nr:hypothetical protein [Tessaracoccus aquimaris]AQP46673.1 hypothetical protein BW730_03155 [Tessaracoccus aquimaris]
MAKRASLPGASELFRPTKRVPTPEPPAATPEPAAVDAQPGASGRIRHDHKITVYFSEDELLALEDANLDLRRAHGIRVDRGRIVRIAVAEALADLAERGAESRLVNELRQQ